MTRMMITTARELVRHRDSVPYGSAHRTACLHREKLFFFHPELYADGTRSSHSTLDRPRRGTTTYPGTARTQIRELKRTKMTHLNRTYLILLKQLTMNWNTPFFEVNRRNIASHIGSQAECRATYATEVGTGRWL